MRGVLSVMVVLLLILHQDNWFWTDPYLVFGIMPVGLFYHCCLSVAAGLVWWWATKNCWPAELEDSSNGEGAA
jgi:hypothetical protein